jgi:hypothetical protein
MAVFTEVSKIEEGRYLVSSLPCPDCSQVFTTEISGDRLFAFRQGAFIQEVLPNLSASERERFMSGYCGDCWKKIFG